MKIYPNVHEKRNKNDYYQTPYSMTGLLLDKEKLNGKILEPAAGQGAIVKVLKEYRYDCMYYDIEKDFFTETNYYDTIITNPPFRLYYDFISKAKEIADNIYFLLPLNYLHGKQRYNTIYKDKIFPLRKIYIFTRYSMLLETVRDDGKYDNGMMVYSWYCWTKGYKGAVEMDWLDNSKDILCKKKPLEIDLFAKK